jgi:hypothetical protein
MAFAYERGIAGYYGYPDWLIEVDLQSILIMASVLYIVVLFTGLLLVLVALMSPARFTRIVLRRFGPILGGLLLLGGLALMNYEAENGKVGTENKWMFLIGLGVILALLLYAILNPLFSKKYTGSRLQRWEQATESSKRKREGIFTAEPDSVSVLDDLLRRYRFVPWALLAVFLSMCAVGSVITMSHFQARTRRLYLVSDTSPPLVALRDYGDRIIAAQLGTDSTLQPSFRILPLVAEQPITWTLKPIGPLRLKASTSK